MLCDSVNFMFVDAWSHHMLKSLAIAPQRASPEHSAICSKTHCHLFSNPERRLHLSYSFLSPLLHTRSMVAGSADPLVDPSVQTLRLTLQAGENLVDAFDNFVNALSVLPEENRPNTMVWNTHANILHQELIRIWQELFLKWQRVAPNQEFWSDARITSDPDLP